MFWKVFSNPTHDEMVERQVKQVKLELLHARNRLEFYQAIVPMLESRLARLSPESAGAEVSASAKVKRAA